MIYLILILMVLLFSIYVFEVKKVKFNTRIIVIISLFAALGYVLNMIKFLRMPQGGSITFFSMLPVMLISLKYGKGVGLTSGILLGCMKMLDGATFLHPIQFLLDYVVANMVLGFSGIFGYRKKINIFMGCFIGGFLSVMCSVLSGVVFFSQYAPDGMSPWLYSIVYNFSSLGIEAILTSIVILFIPIDRLFKEKS